MTNLTRCSWATKHDIFITYHDEEWGVPQHADRKLFEMLNLEGAQAGLSWLTILQKREHYLKVFDNFEPEICAAFTDEYLESLRLDPGIVRNRLKINSVRSNAHAFLKVRDEFGSFDKYIWQFVGGNPIINSWKELSEIPATTPESDAMSKDLKKRGFKFIGSTICYAFMQATGMVNDHTVDCFCY
jgi:DNA-3-methyladenine glycosylase I